MNSVNLDHFDNRWHDKPHGMANSLQAETNVLNIVVALYHDASLFWRSIVRNEQMPQGLSTPRCVCVCVLNLFMMTPQNLDVKQRSVYCEHAVLKINFELKVFFK